MSAKFRKMEKMQIDELYIYVERKKTEKMLKIPDFVNRYFHYMQFAAVTSKYSLVSHIFELGTLYDAANHHSKMY